MRFFSKRTKLDPVPTPTHIEVRSYYSQAMHILKVGDENPICGYSNWLPTNTEISVVASSVINTIENQHEGWFWCRSCASILTGLPEETFNRKS